MALPIFRGALRPARGRGRRLAVWIFLAGAAIYFFLFGFMESEEDNFDELFGEDPTATKDQVVIPTPPPSKAASQVPLKKTTSWSLQRNGKISIQIDDTGDLELPDGVAGKPRHPILDLIDGAEKRWNDMTKSNATRSGQGISKALWAAAPKRLRQMFDQIDHDIAPYLALKPRTMQQRIGKLETHKDAFHIVVKGGKLTYTHTPTRDLTRITDMVALVEDFAEFLPDMEVHASLHDTGSHVLREDYRREAMQKVGERGYLSKENVTFFENKKTIPRKRVTKACLDDAPAVLQENGLLPQSTHGKSMEFIQDHGRTMNFCHNPEILASHGVFIWDLARDSFLEPFFVGCKLAQGPEILMPALVGFSDSKSEAPPAWSTRKAKAFWRGSTTGNHFTIKDWKRSHRIALHFLANGQEGQEAVLLEDVKKGLVAKSFSRKELNERYMDIGLVGKPIQCEKKDGTCEEMTKQIDFKPRAAPNLGSQYKYAVDVGSVILKATIFPEWNADWLIPWYHYVITGSVQPIQMDYSDVYNTMAFFAGSPDGSSPGHDKLAEKISQNSVRFVQENWRWEDMQAYMFRLLLEYARLASDDRDAMNYKP
ncbi:F-actin-capping protein subunit alpha [Tulasnella sp. 408]|nr:F-actin-capping protein subunit alpha [Tulasnella sp. 408]